MEEKYIGTAQAAKILGISRVAIFKRIKSGKIKAKKIGRNFVIEKNSLGTIYQEITKTEEEKIEKAISKIFKEYEPALKKLGKE